MSFGSNLLSTAILDDVALCGLIMDGGSVDVLSDGRRLVVGRDEREVQRRCSTLVRMLRK